MSDKELPVIDGLIYLASPYSHDDTRIRDDRFREVCKWAARLMRAGHLVFSPIAHTHPIAMAGELPTGWDFWQKYDHAQLDAAVELWVLKLDGWDASKGVAGEVEYMKKKGRPIKYIDPVAEQTEDRAPSAPSSLTAAIRPLICNCAGAVGQAKGFLQGVSTCERLLPHQRGAAEQFAKELESRWDALIAELEQLLSRQGGTEQ